jgi:flagellar biogenesis protein FliO
VFSFNRKNFAPFPPPASGFSGLAALIQRFVPGLGRRGSVGGMLEHLGTMPLTAQSSLALVRLNGETLLLGVTPQNISLLTKGSDPAAGASPRALPSGETAVAP